MSSSCLPHMPGPRTLATHERVSIFEVGPVSRRQTTGTAPMSLRRTRELTFINPCTRMGSRCVFSALVECRKYYIEPPPQMCDESVHSPDLPAAERRHGAVVVAGRRNDGVGGLLALLPKCSSGASRTPESARQSQHPGVGMFTCGFRSMATTLSSFPRARDGVPAASVFYGARTRTHARTRVHTHPRRT